MKPQKIVRLQAENIKRIKAVEVTPEGDLVVVGGNNAQGKSSLLDSIEMALGGKRSVPQEPVRRGEKRGRVIVETEDLVVERTFTKGGSQLTVKGKEGEIFTSPQKLLDSLVGELSFDPLEFDRKKPAEQLEVLKRIAGLDFDKLDRERQEAYERRRELNRSAKRLTATIDETPVEVKNAPRSAPSVSEIAEELESAQEQNRKNADLANELKELRRDRTHLAQEIDNLEARLSEMKKNAGQMDHDGKKLRDRVAKCVDVDVVPIQEKLERASEEIRLATEAIEYDRRQRELDELSERAVEQDEFIRTVDEQKQKAVENANMPVPGLGFGDGCVLLNDLPLEQASGAERLRVSFAISRALAGDLRIALSRDGSLLDKKSLQAVASLCAESGCQLWLERVGDGEEVSIVIEDGLARSGESK